VVLLCTITVVKYKLTGSISGVRVARDRPVPHFEVAEVAAPDVR
jgi:hypothetical protein